MHDETIKKRLKIIQDLQEELNKLQEQYQDALESDSQYVESQERLEELKEEAKEKREVIKQKVTQNSSYSALKNEINEKKMEIKENKEVLSQELVTYFKETGIVEIEDTEGNLKKMKFSVRLVG